MNAGEIYWAHFRKKWREDKRRQRLRKRMEAAGATLVKVDRQAIWVVTGGRQPRPDAER